MKTCANCAFSVHDQTGNFCRRMPPTFTPIIAEVNARLPNGQVKAVPQQIGGNSNFPFVQPDWWCGEWKQGILVGIDGKLPAAIGMNGG